MKYSILAGAVLAITMAGFGVSQAQTDNGQAGGGHGGGLRQACQADLEKLCAGVQPGGGRVIACMREHKDQLSDGCKAAMSSVRGHGHGDGAQSASSPQG